jgi:hypothetical protein
MTKKQMRSSRKRMQHRVKMLPRKSKNVNFDSPGLMSQAMALAMASITGGKNSRGMRSRGE